MTVKTGNEYIESLRKRKMKVYLFGKKVENPVDHPIIRPSVNSVAVTYDVANDPKYEDLATATSHLTGEKVNRFTHIHQSTQDLVKKVKMLRLLGQKTGICFQRCVGMDSLKSPATGSMTVPLLALVALTVLGFFLSTRLRESTWLAGTE